MMIEMIELLDKVDWNFKGVKTQYLSHTFHSYPARFIPQIPATFIKLFTREGDTVLDPFVGCGTTLVEAFLYNRNSIGNDLNPLAVLISKVKTMLINEDNLKYFNDKLVSLNSYIDRQNIEEIYSKLPRRKLSRVFNSDVISKLMAIRRLLLELKDD